MIMKKAIALWIALCLLLAGCTSSQADGNGNSDSTTDESTCTTDAGQEEDTITVIPLPDTTMENLTDAILSVSLEEGDAYVDDTGKMQMDLKIYSFDRYDMVDIANLKIGDTIVRHSGKVEITALERNNTGTVSINGGLDNGGFDLVTDDSSTFYEMGFNDHKSWYEVGEATIRVSVDFLFTDNADLEQGEMIFYPGSFLIGEITNYDFTPYNTTIRVAEGQIVEMNRRYIP